MKPSVLFVYSLLLCFATPALAAVDPNNCVSQSSHMPRSERDAYIKSCMAQVSSPAHVKELELQNKRALCEQNAKNHNLQGNEKSNYLTTCMNKNDAEAVAKGQGVPAQSVAKAPAAKTKAKPAPVKSAAKDPAPKPQKTAGLQGRGNSCAQQAKKKGLKGDARKQFMSSCKSS